MNGMKLRKFVFLAAAAGAVAAFVQKKQQQEAPEAAADIWKPVDPLRPFGERDDEE